MNAPVPVSDPLLHADYFISRAAADKALAIWIGQLVAAQGKRYVLEDDHFGHHAPPTATCATSPTPTCSPNGGRRMTRR